MARRTRGVQMNGKYNVVCTPRVQTQVKVHGQFVPMGYKFCTRGVQTILREDVQKLQQAEHAFHSYDLTVSVKISLNERSRT